MSTKHRYTITITDSEGEHDVTYEADVLNMSGRNELGEKPRTSYDCYSIGGPREIEVKTQHITLELEREVNR